MAGADRFPLVMLDETEVLVSVRTEITERVAQIHISGRLDGCAGILVVPAVLHLLRRGATTIELHTVRVTTANADGVAVLVDARRRVLAGRARFVLTAPAVAVSAAIRALRQERRSLDDGDRCGSAPPGRDG